MRAITIALTLTILFCSTLADTTPRETLKKVCQTSKLLSLYKKSELSFTFNAKLPNKTVTRKWRWDIKANKCYLDGVLQTETAAFVNDTYWLIYPLKAFHDKKGTALELKKEAISPINKTPCQELTITHIGNQGKTPNDAYKLYINKDFQIIEWAYLKGGKLPPKKITTWEKYTTSEGISFSTIRKSKGTFMIWFEDIKVVK